MPLADVYARRPVPTGSHEGDGPALTRTVAAGGAALAIGAAGTPTAGALTILLPGPTVDGESNTTRIDIFEGNIFNPQFGASTATPATT